MTGKFVVLHGARHAELLAAEKRLIEVRARVAELADHPGATSPSLRYDLEALIAFARTKESS